KHFGPLSNRWYGLKPGPILEQLLNRQYGNPSDFEFLKTYDPEQDDPIVFSISTTGDPHEVVFRGYHEGRVYFWNPWGANGFAEIIGPSIYGNVDPAKFTAISGAKIEDPKLAIYSYSWEEFQQHVQTVWAPA